MAQWDFVMALRREEEWVWGWDTTPGIVSVWASLDGRPTVWRRIPKTGELLREETRFRPWLVLDRLDDLQVLGDRLGPEGGETATTRYRELDGPGSLRFLVFWVGWKSIGLGSLRGCESTTGPARTPPA
jgi:DNA polymerase, archaea type